MSEGKLKTAVLGLADGSQTLLDAALEVGYFQIEAVADKESEVAQRTAEQYKCSAYDDYRQLVMQNEFDCLLVAAGLYSCDQHVKSAMKKKFNVLKLAPLGRNFEEGAELVRLAEEGKIRFAVANPCRFAGNFLDLRVYLRQERIEQTFLLTATCAVGGKERPSWQTDPQQAGGGVLLRNCYDIIDQIVWNFGLPEQVYSLNSSRAPDKQQRLCLTEDTALATMKFSDTLIGTLTASRCVTAEPRKLLTIYGKDKTLSVSDNRFIVSSTGRADEQTEYADDEFSCMKGVLENFALSIISPDNNSLCSTGRENLMNMAVIESAYLSGRTGMPEEPGRILQMAGSQPGPKITKDTIDKQLER